MKWCLIFLLLLVIVTQSDKHTTRYGSSESEKAKFDMATDSEPVNVEREEYSKVQRIRKLPKKSSRLETVSPEKEFVNVPDWLNSEENSKKMKNFLVEKMPKSEGKEATDPFKEDSKKKSKNHGPVLMEHFVKSGQSRNQKESAKMSRSRSEARLNVSVSQDRYSNRSSRPVGSRRKIGTGKVLTVVKVNSTRPTKPKTPTNSSKPIPHPKFSFPTNLSTFVTKEEYGRIAAGKIVQKHLEACQKMSSTASLPDCFRKIGTDVKGEIVAELSKFCETHHSKNKFPNENVCRQDGVIEIRTMLKQLLIVMFGENCKNKKAAKCPTDIEKYSTKWISDIGLPGVTFNVAHVLNLCSGSKDLKNASAYLKCIEEKETDLLGIWKEKCAEKLCRGYKSRSAQALRAARNVTEILKCINLECVKKVEKTVLEVLERDAAVKCPRGAQACFKKATKPIKSFFNKLLPKCHTAVNSTCPSAFSSLHIISNCSTHSNSEQYKICVNATTNNLLGVWKSGCSDDILSICHKFVEFGRKAEETSELVSQLIDCNDKECIEERSKVVKESIVEEVKSHCEGAVPDDACSKTNPELEADSIIKKFLPDCAKTPAESRCLPPSTTSTTSAPSQSKPSVVVQIDGYIRTDFTCDNIPEEYAECQHLCDEISRNTENDDWDWHTIVVWIIAAFLILANIWIYVYCHRRFKRMELKMKPKQSKEEREKAEAKTRAYLSSEIRRPWQKPIQKEDEKPDPDAEKQRQELRMKRVKKRNREQKKREGIYSNVDDIPGKPWKHMGHVSIPKEPPIPPPTILPDGIVLDKVEYHPEENEVWEVGSDADSIELDDDFKIEDLLSTIEEVDEEDVDKDEKEEKTSDEKVKEEKKAKSRSEKDKQKSSKNKGSKEQEKKSTKSDTGKRSRSRKSRKNLESKEKDSKSTKNLDVTGMKDVKKLQKGVQSKEHPEKREDVRKSRKGQNQGPEKSSRSVKSDPKSSGKSKNDEPSRKDPKQCVVAQKNTKTGNGSRGETENLKAKKDPKKKKNSDVEKPGKGSRSKKSRDGEKKDSNEEGKGKMDEKKNKESRE